MEKKFRTKLSNEKGIFRKIYFRLYFSIAVVVVVAVAVVGAKFGLCFSLYSLPRMISTMTIELGVLQ